MKNILPLAELKKGQEGVVFEIKGGQSLQNRLEALGIRKGIKIKKISEIRGGPVVIGVGNTQVAIGKGMAQKITIKKEDYYE